MDFDYTAIIARMNIALMAILFTIVIQCGLILISKILSKSMLPMPLFEMVIRPLVIKMSDRLNRADRTDFALIMRGFIVFFIIFAIISGAFITLDIIFKYMPISNAIAQAILLTLILSPISSLICIYTVSKGHDYKGLAMGLNQNLIPTDKHGMRREGAKLLSISLTDWFLFPIIIFIVLGWPFVWAFIAISIFIRFSASPQSPFTLLFEKIYGCVSIILNIPVFMIMVISSVFAIGSKPFKIIKALKHPKNMIMAGFAYCQDVVLGGDHQTRYGNRVKAKWIGEEGASAKLDHKAVLRFLIFQGTVIFVSCALLFMVTIYL